MYDLLCSNKSYTTCFGSQLYNRYRILHKTQNNYNHQLLSEITALREEVKELKQTQRSKFHTTQAETNEQKSEGICWYHQTFKNKATKCNPPCNYKNPLNE